MGPADEGHGAGAGTSLLPQPDAATNGARTFEEAFAAVEQAAQAAEAAVRKLATATRRLRKAAQEGNITAIRRDGSQLTSALAATGRRGDRRNGKLAVRGNRGGDVPD